MLNSEEKVTVESSERLMSDEEGADVERGISERLLIDNVDDTHSVHQSSTTDRDCQISDGGEESSRSSTSNRSVRLASSSESSQLSRISAKKSPSISSGSRSSSPTSSLKSKHTSSRRLSLGSSGSSENDELDKTVLPFPSSSQSSNASLNSQHSFARLQSTQSLTQPNSSRKSLSSDSDEDIVASRRSKPVKFFDSDGTESGADAVNESPKKVSISEENASSLEEPETRTLTKKRRKKRLILDSGGSGSSDENDTTLSTIQNTASEVNHDSESKFSNRRKKLVKMNEEKRCEFAKLAEKKKSRNSKRNEDENTLTDANVQPHTEESGTKPKKFLLLSDGDLSDSEGPEKPLVYSDSENYEKKRNAKSTKRKNCGEARKSNSKKSKNQVTGIGDTEDASGTKKRKKPSTRVPKSGITPEEPKESKRKSKKQQEAMLEIKSTTQKMIREGRIALPYHQPKHRSLDEFLQRRSNAPSIPLRASYDLLSLAKERFIKTEEEIVEFYKSESEHSEGEHRVDDTQNVDEKSAPETNAIDSALSPENFLLEHDVLGVNASNVNRLDFLENNSSTKHITSEVNDESASVFDSLGHPEKMACNSLETKTDELRNERSNDSPLNTLPTHEYQRTTEESTMVTIPESVDPSIVASDTTCQISVKVVKNNSPRNSDEKIAVTESDMLPEKNNKSFEDEVHEYIDEGRARSNEVREENDKVNDEGSVSYGSTELAKENGTCLSEDVDDCTQAQDTEDICLEIENSCPTEANISAEPRTTLSVDPPLRIDPETLRQKKLELLSSRNVTLSDPKLKKDQNSVVQFEIDDVPGSVGVRSFMEKFASHVTAKKKTKKQSAKLNVTNVQMDSQGEIVDIVKETLFLKSFKDDENDVEDKFTVPGSKYSFFKDTMLKTLISNKTANWEKYQEEKYSFLDKDHQEYGDIDEENEVEELGIREPNFKPYRPEEEPDDEDLEEDDVDMTEEPDKKKNEYLDEEAEVDFDEDENVMGGSDQDADSEGESGMDDVEESDHDDLGENNEDVLELEKKNHDEEEEVDSDEELLNNIFKESGKKESTTKESCVPSKLFKSNTTGEDLENKVLQLDSGSQFEDFSSTQIFSVCSGKFATQIVPPVSHETSQFFTDSQFADDSQGFNLSMQETNDGFQTKDSKTSDIVSKNSFLLSDESDTEELFNMKRRAMQLEDSDDDESVEHRNEEDGNNPNDNEVVEEEQEEDGQSDNDLDEELVYNSEEEIVDHANIKATDFFDNEAELSESEWGSEDENENDLDGMEKEAGDEDEIDDDRLKEELGRIHMRHLMDDDQKNVRLLQEILLEDGDLHSDGQRNRKFQWKNLDGDSFLKNFFGDSDDENVLIDDNNLNDDEKTKNWRQMRHEREMFLSKQEKNNDLLLSAEDERSSFIRISSTAKVTTKSAVSERPTISAPLKSPNAKFSFHTKSKCGSFLSRGQQLLNRIVSNVGESKENNIQGAKNSRNFVFAAKSVEEVVSSSVTAENPAEKRKISSRSVMARKKLKLTVDAVSDHTAPSRPGLLAQLSLTD